MVKNTGCSCRGLKFNSQQLYGSSDLSVTPVPRLMTLSHRHTGRRNTEPWKNLTSEPGSREDHQPEDRNPEKPV